MDRNILILGNCQTGGLWASLAAMLPGDRIDATMWLGSESPDLGERLRGVDVLVTTLDRRRAEALLDDHESEAEVITVPPLNFFGFHPDLYPLDLAGGVDPGGPVGPYHSKIVLWGWLHGHSADRIISAFSAEAFERLGYLDSWPLYLSWLRGVFEPTDIDFASWYLRIVRRGVFMLTNNHPRVDAIIELARGVARILGAETRLVDYDWTQVIPDGLLATAPVWPIYPGVAESLDLPGAFVWRLADGNLIGLEEFVRHSLGAYRAINPATIDRSPFDIPRFADVLSAGTPTAVTAGGA